MQGPGRGTIRHLLGGSRVSARSARRTPVPWGGQFGSADNVVRPQLSHARAGALRPARKTSLPLVLLVCIGLPPAAAAIDATGASDGLGLLGGVRHVTVNPDGAPAAAGRIAFERGLEREAQVATVNADGSGYRLLSARSGRPEGDPSWSPDSRQVAF